MEAAALQRRRQAPKAAVPNLELNRAFQADLCPRRNYQALKASVALILQRLEVAAAAVGNLSALVHHHHLLPKHRFKSQVHPDRYRALVVR